MAAIACCLQHSSSQRERKARLRRRAPAVAAGVCRADGQRREAAAKDCAAEAQLVCPPLAVQTTAVLYSARVRSLLAGHEGVGGHSGATTLALDTRCLQ